jgi:hypothetical protein
MKRRAMLLLAILGLAATVPACRAGGGPPKPPLVVKLDDAGPYAILATRRAAKDYAGAVEKAMALHPKAERGDFDPGDLAEAYKFLRKLQPRYALVVMAPDELDVNFAWRWLEMTSRLDNDPFVDVRTGFITGSDAKAAEALVARIADAALGRLTPPAAFIDNAGPPEVGDQKYFNTFPRSDFVPALGDRLALRSVFHGKGCFTDERLGSLDGAGLIHFGGHGFPDRVQDGLTAAQLPGLKLAPCVVSSGACYSGVTRRWFDALGPKLAEKAVEPGASFCLRLLERDVLGYFASLHPDHGMPVYQELEYLAVRGGSLGGAIKATYDGVVLGNGGKLPAFVELKDGADRPRWGPAEVMLHGTASRVLFGDPALVLVDGFARAPFSVAVKEEAGVLRVTAILDNPGLKSWLTDTYHNDLNPKAPFNDRAVFAVDLPEGWPAVGKVEVLAVRAGSKALEHRLVGWAVEHDQGTRQLQVQVDVRADGFQQSAFRAAGATVELVMLRSE